MKPGALRRTLSVAVLLILTAVLTALAWSRWGTLGAAEATLEGPYRTEEHWIAAEIAKDVLEMAQFARDPRARPERLEVAVEPLFAGEPGPGVAVSFSLGAGPRHRQVIQWKHHIWSPEDYEALARGALAASGAAQAVAAPANDETALAALTSPLARVIETQNQRVSQRLARSMRDADAHEEAALVVGALVVREASESFWDVRQLLCRMAAHLSLARALGRAPAYGLSGRYADAILASYAGRSTEAMTKLGALEASAAGSESQRAWVRALKMWLTVDWRPVAQPSQRTLIERVLYFRVLGWTLSPAAAFNFYTSIDAEPIADWGRIALESNFGTEVGAFAREGAEPELAEARDVWRRMYGRELAGSELVDELNRPAARCITAEGPRVLAWGTWAAALQRHVCHRVLHIDRYWRNMVALPDQAQAQLAAFDGEFAGLGLYPYVQALRWKHGEIHLETFSSGLTRGVSTAAEHPELLTAFVWDRTADTARYAVTRRRMPPLLPWFAALAPSGTAYDANTRLRIAGFAQAPSEPLNAVHERNPWNYGLNSQILEARFGSQPTPEQIRTVFGPRADYDAWVLNWMANAAGGRSPERARLLDQACQLLADKCLTLAYHLVAARRDEDAVRALQRAFEGAFDRVDVANNSLLLTRYYHDRGQDAEATRVAEHAAETYSSRGLETMGRLLEWRGKFDEAEDYFSQIERRYEEARSLAGFYHRMVKAGRSAYESKLQSAIRSAFPRGLEKLDTAHLAHMPSDGVGLSNTGPDAPLAGLETGDIVVGLDGWRVHDLEQYMTVREFDWRPDMTMYLWRRGRYMELQVHLLDRYLPLDLHTHPVDAH